MSRSLLSQRIGGALALLILVAGSGCWVPLSQGKAMEADIVALKRQMDDQKAEMNALESRQERERQRFKREQDQALSQVNESIDNLNRVARRTGADLAVELEQTVGEVARLRGILEEIQIRLQMEGEQITLSLPELERRVNEALLRLSALEELAKGKPLVLPSDKDEFYELAKSTLDSGDAPQARTLFSEFVSRWPNDTLSANAHYWIGESYYAERRYREAIPAFAVVMERFSKSDKLPDALLKIGFCFIELDQADRGKDFLEEVKKNHSKSAAAKIARERLAKM